MTHKSHTHQVFIYYDGCKSDQKAQTPMSQGCKNSSISVRISPTMSSVLTVSSHVIHGYVGNKAIVFPLQCCGWEVDNINTVNYSNHTGYGKFKGDCISTDLLCKLLDNVQPSDFLITGYVPNNHLIETLSRFLCKYDKLPFIYLMDPILGDEGQLYVDESCVESFRHLVSRKVVDIITPNQFELELLTGIKIKSMTDLVSAINAIKLHQVTFIVVTSCKVQDDFIHCVISTSTSDEIRFFKVPLIRAYFTGIGDLFSGLLIDKLNTNYYQKLGQDELESLSKSVSQVLTIMTEVLNRTREKGLKSGHESRIGTLEIGNYELDLIDSRDLFGGTDCGFDFEVLDV